MRVMTRKSRPYILSLLFGWEESIRETLSVNQGRNQKAGASILPHMHTVPVTMSSGAVPIVSFYQRKSP